MSNQPQIIQAAVDHLRAGGVVAFPTETVYGLGADALSHAAVGRVFELKGRPAFNPLIVHVTGPEMAGRVCIFDERAEKLTRALWPGPVSIILPKRDSVPGLVTAGGPTVAVRCPSHPLALALLYEFDGPLVGPSANRSGGVSPTRAEHVHVEWPQEDVLVLDGGPCRGGIESTVLSLVGPARILRPGLVGALEIARALEEPVLDLDQPNNSNLSDPHPRPSPGMLERHYAPRTPAVLAPAGELPRLLAKLPNTARAVVLGGDACLSAPHANVELIRMPADAEMYAAALYDALRRADAHNAALIFIEQPPGNSELWRAIADRLRRATSPE